MKDIFIYYGLTAIALIITLGAQFYISVSYSKYSKIAASRGFTGAMAARTVLDRHGLRDVSVSQVAGSLSDHYDPRKKQVKCGVRRLVDRVNCGCLSRMRPRYPGQRELHLHENSFRPCSRNENFLVSRLSGHRNRMYFQLIYPYLYRYYRRGRYPAVSAYYPSR